MMYVYFVQLTVTQYKNQFYQKKSFLSGKTENLTMFAEINWKTGDLKIFKKILTSNKLFMQGFFFTWKPLKTRKNLMFDNLGKKKLEKPGFFNEFYMLSNKIST